MAASSVFSDENTKKRTVLPLSAYSLFFLSFSVARALALQRSLAAEQREPGFQGEAAAVLRGKQGHKMCFGKDKFVLPSSSFFLYNSEAAFVSGLFPIR